AAWRGHRLALVDTGGWTPGWARDETAYDTAVSAQAERATRDADVVVFVVDVTVGVTEEDAAAAAWLREAGVPVVLAANKADTRGFDAELAELYALGFDTPHPVSAQHGRGSGDLLDVVVDRLRDTGALDRDAGEPDEVPGVALIGRPNVGKSSLFNRLLGEERTIVDERPGTTRDAVDTVVELDDGRAYRFVDTAGLRRKLRRGASTEYYSTVRTVQALDAASVALLVVDAADEIGEQEQRLARQILDAGRALVVVLNKWDLLDEYRREVVDRERDRLLHFVAWAPLVRTSARTGRGVDRLLPAVDAVLAQWQRRIPTAALNTWLAHAVAATAPPLDAGRPVRVRYAAQVGVAPPTFRLFTTGELPPAYLRYLERRLRKDFGFAGTPLDVAVRVRTRWEDRDDAPVSSRSRSAARGRRRR
ncbi:MAG: ribosome biogenesis GTPase Der, partial [Actinomycetota bacterium]|nr:ribosome biogenesis GTPase Der [Actinomycetota bacterium]